MEGRVFVERRETGKVYYGGCGHEPVSLDEVRYPGGREQAIERMLPVLERAKLVPFFVGDRQWCAALLAAAEGRNDG